MPNRAHVHPQSSCQAVAPEVFDPQTILARVRGDRALVVEIIEIFLADYPHMIGEMYDAVAAHDAGKLESAAHRLRGSVGHFATSTPYKIAKQLESMGQKNHLEGALKTLSALEAEIDQLTAALKEFASSATPLASRRKVE